MSTWRYMQNGQQLGPVDTAALLALLRSGIVTHETTVCKEGSSNWAPIRTEPELSSAEASFPSVQPTSGAATPLADGQTPDGADVDKNKIFAVLAYVSILFLVPLLAAKGSRYARYHTNQGVVLFLTAFVCWLGIDILTRFLIASGFILFVQFFLPVVFIGNLVLIVLGIINAAQGVCKPLPVIGQFRLIK
jgi:uncharacterized membrane protein